MNQAIRMVKGASIAGAMVALGLGLRWVTAGSMDAAASEDLASMAGVAIGAVAWVAYCWLIVAFLATALEQAPGAVGRSAAVVADWITSQSSRALLRSALGVAAVSPLTIAVAHAAPGNSGPHHSVQQPSTAWGAVEKASAVRLGESLRQDQVRDQGQGKGHGRWADVEPRSAVQLIGITVDEWRSVEQPSRAGVVPEQRRPAPRVGVPDRPTDGAPTRYTDLQSGRAVRPVQPARSPRHHVVRRGDSLWAIAAAELGPSAPDAAVAARWPQWYAANNAVIGPDPGLLLPGQVLRAPSQVPSQVPSHVPSAGSDQISGEVSGEVSSHAAGHLTSQARPSTSEEK